MPSRDVLIDMWVVRRFAGEPQGLDGQALRWCAVEDLEASGSVAGGWAHRRGAALAGALEPSVDAVL